MARKPFPSDLIDAQWEPLAPLIPDGEPGGQPRSVAKRKAFSSIFYLLRTGCSLRHLPH